MSIIIVQKDGLSYICLPVPGKYKCGKCLRGNIFGTICERCRVCNAVVSDIQRSNTDMKGPSHDAKVAVEVARRLGSECKEQGKDTFTMADVRRVRRDIYEGG